MLLDVIGLILIALFFIRGYTQGLIVAAFSVIAILLGILCALKLSQSLSAWLLANHYVTSGWVQLILKEAGETWADTRLGVHHRTGRLELGEASIIIVAASPHRAHAFAACRYTIERVKQIVPIWKHEHFEGGDVWLEGATADPADEVARETARRIACA